MRRSSALAATALVLLLAAGCLPFLKPARAPMRTIELDSGGDAKCLAVLLPGRFGGPEDYVRAGFAESVRDRGLALDLVAVDAHLGYYRKRSIVDRLRADVIAPAAAAGYDEIWIVGVSLGGLGSLIYTRERPSDVAGTLALAPFLGKRELIEEIREQGGLEDWQATDDDDLSQLWEWLRKHLAAHPDATLHLGWGTDDDLAPGAELLAESLPENQVYTWPGGHDWKVWAALWEAFLDREDLCAPAVSDAVPTP